MTDIDTDQNSSSSTDNTDGYQNPTQTGGTLILRTGVSSSGTSVPIGTTISNGTGTTIVWTGVPIWQVGFPSPSPILEAPTVDDHPLPEEKSEGCRCKKCTNFFEFAEPNQEDKSFICYACRHNL